MNSHFPVRKDVQGFEDVAMLFKEAVAGRGQPGGKGQAAHIALYV